MVAPLFLCIKKVYGFHYSYKIRINLRFKFLGLGLNGIMSTFAENSKINKK